MREGEEREGGVLISDRNVLFPENGTEQQRARERRREGEEDERRVSE